MMEKLKEAGNKFLGLFGMSTDNFKMTQVRGRGAAEDLTCSSSHIWLFPVARTECRRRVFDGVPKVILPISTPRRLSVRRRIANSPSLPVTGDGTCVGRRACIEHIDKSSRNATTHVESALLPKPLRYDVGSRAGSCTLTSHARRSNQDPSCIKSP